MMKSFKLIIFLLIVLMLSSCFGISANIVLNQNGSGSINLEYQISKSLDSIGRLDGNQRWNTIPVGRSDFERTLSRLQDIRLLSFSDREDENNIYFYVRLEFSNMQGLLSFLDAYGQLSIYSEINTTKSLTLILSPGSEISNPLLLHLLSDISYGYYINIEMNFPGEGSLTVNDGLGNIIKPLSRGRNLSASIPLFDVLSSSNGINLEFNWQ